MKTIEIIFSPTGGTEKVAGIIARRWSGQPETIDLSDTCMDFSLCSISAEDMVIIAMPSFAGRAPAVAVERLRKIKGNGARCTLVCVYGNRAYEDTLAEMEDAAKDCGFKVTAAIAAVAEHSIITKYAEGRPDATDKAQLEGFADTILKGNGSSPVIPGNRPYKKAGGAALVPKPDKACMKCGKCARECPVKAISPDTLKAEGGKCIGCMRCVKRCPKGARKVNGAMVSVAALAIKKACSVRKENELYI